MRDIVGNGDPIKSARHAQISLNSEASQSCVIVNPEVVAVNASIPPHVTSLRMVHYMP
jgi:hypothetical protein